MYLLNAHTKQLEEFVENVPAYAILSHTWENDEILFQDVMLPGGCEGKAGWLKVDLACRQTVKDDLGYVWIDTCCIDKSSSAELSEAINSMFRWYQDSTVCYVFLKDIKDENANADVLKTARWFSRGWTLQELIAPTKVVFYNAFWVELGTKLTLRHPLKSVTGIPIHVLRNMKEVFSQSVAQRLCWASHRQTTRVEDTAYCLLGLFGVNMPLLYGEAHMAFFRLQEEIIKVTDDQSIFAWEADPKLPFLTGLAASPACFARSNKIIPLPSDTSVQAYAISQKGLGINMELVETGAFSGRHQIHIGVLQCQESEVFRSQVVIHLVETDTPNLFNRCSYRGNYLGFMDHIRLHAAEARSIYITTPFQYPFQQRESAVLIVKQPSTVRIFAPARARYVYESWNQDTGTFRLRRTVDAHSHDLAAGVIVEPLASKNCAFLVTVYFPHRSSDGTSLGGVAIYEKPADWSMKDWRKKAERDMSLVHVREQDAEQKLQVARLGSENHRLRVSLNTTELLRQRVYILNVEHERVVEEPLASSGSDQSRFDFTAHQAATGFPRDGKHTIRNLDRYGDSDRRDRWL